MSRADVNDPIESLGLSEKHAELIKREIVEKSGSLDHVKNIGINSYEELQFWLTDSTNQYIYVGIMTVLNTLSIFIIGCCIWYPSDTVLHWFGFVCASLLMGSSLSVFVYQIRKVIKFIISYRNMSYFLSRCQSNKDIQLEKDDLIICQSSMKKDAKAIASYFIVGQSLVCQLLSNQLLYHRHDIIANVLLKISGIIMDLMLVYVMIILGFPLIVPVIFSIALIFTQLFKESSRYLCYKHFSLVSAKQLETICTLNNKPIITST